MKNRTLLLILIVGMLITIVGALFKIMHWPGHSVAMGIGLLTEFVVATLIIIKLLQKSDRPGGFLDN